MSVTFLLFLKMHIPVVDAARASGAGEQLRGLGQELKAAFTDVGFVFLKNTGITREEVRPAENPNQHLVCSKCVEVECATPPYN